ncbi:uncharacterized protein F5Z01DRAFT_295156 [Emericellopsis atlantica]|uniref:Mid2 domain-containing protein n=1 Tax=Emericellopsis atlantica TaxID=2614577 RepID=A0A9P7ZGQ5_9HYPO|nr:uncharacterized protein F5Z01DRAFT_295156 [Emericellopsis atlantica]KAG9251148.1 hypothetical protein F5Z01DRAFT_295156 [Emericellopsis atlantica]
MSVAIQTPGVFAVTSIPAPLVTAGPDLFRRQDDTETCGFWSFSDRTSPYSEYVCPGGCTTQWSAGLHGCKDTFASTCYDANDSYCSSDVSLLPGELCCTGDTYTNCVTASKKDEGRWLVAYECWVGLSGEAYISVSATIVETTDGTTVTTEITTDVPTATETDDSGESKATNSPTADASESETAGSATSDASTSDSTGDASEDDSKDSSGAPIGAIVGGVIGGVALILGIAFGLWFMRFYKRKHAKQTGAEPMREDHPNTSYYGGAGGAYVPPAGTSQGGSPSVTSGYHGSSDPSHGSSYPMQNGAWGYQLPAEAKPAQPHAPVEMPGSHERAELQ